MKKIIIALIVIAVIAVIVLNVNKKPAPTSSTTATESTKPPIKIGAVLSLTSFAAPWGEYAKNSMNLAVKSINDNGGINGRKIELVIEDDHTDAKQAVSAYTKLTSVDKVDGVIGGVFDFTAQPLIPLALSSKTAFISPSNFYLKDSLELNDQSFVMLPEFKNVIRELKPYLVDTKVKKLAVVHFKSAFGNEIAKTLDQVMKENKQAGIVNEEYTSIGGNDFRTIIAKLKGQKVDAVFLDMVGDDPLTFLTQAKQLGLKAKFISYNGISDAFTKKNDIALLEGVVILNWEVVSRQFAEYYKGVYGINPTKSADKYFDSVYVMAQAIANTNDKAGVASYIANTSFKAPNNTIVFSPEHYVKSTPVQVTIVKNGEQIPYKK